MVFAVCVFVEALRYVLGMNIFPLFVFFPFHLGEVKNRLQIKRENFSDYDYISFNAMHMYEYK